MKDKRIALIGLGGIAHISHMDAFTAAKGCKIVAGCDIDERKFALARAKCGLDNFYTDYRDMLRKEDLDAVVVGTPNATHMPITVAALEAGVNVLCEKPAAPTRKEAEKMRETARRTKKKLMIGMTFRFRNETELLKKYVQQGKLGNIYYAKTSYLRTRGIPGWGTWFTDKKRSGGGAVVDCGVHILDYIWYLMGKPAFKSVTAITFDGIGQRHLRGEEAAFGKIGYPPTYTGPDGKNKKLFDVEEIGSAFIRYANGVALQFEVSWAMNYDPSKQSSGGTIFGDRGGLSLMPAVFTHEKRGQLVHEPLEVKGQSAPRNLAQSFIDFLNGRIENPAPIEDAAQVVGVLEAIYKSAKLGKEVQI